MSVRANGSVPVEALTLLNAVYTARTKDENKEIKKATESFSAYDAQKELEIQELSTANQELEAEVIRLMKQNEQLGAARTAEIRVAKIFEDTLRDKMDLKDQEIQALQEKNSCLKAKERELFAMEIKQRHLEERATQLELELKQTKALSAVKLKAAEELTQTLQTQCGRLQVKETIEELKGALAKQREALKEIDTQFSHFLKIKPSALTPDYLALVVPNLLHPNVDRLYAIIESVPSYTVAKRHCGDSCVAELEMQHSTCRMLLDQIQGELKKIKDFIPAMFTDNLNEYQILHTCMTKTHADVQKILATRV